MKRAKLSLLIAALALLANASSAWATIDKIEHDLCDKNPGHFCAPTTKIPIFQGETTVITVRGFATESTTRLDFNAGRLSAKKENPFGAIGYAKIKITVFSDAEPGETSIDLHYAVELNGFDTFKIIVVRKGKITGVEAPSPNAYFTEASVTFRGNHLGNAKMDFTNPNPAGTTATITSNTESQLVVKLSFPTQVAEGGGEIKLRDRGYNFVPIPDNAFYKNNGQESTKVNVLGPNAVSSITFPDGNNVTVGGNITIQINLVRPARYQQPTFVGQTGQGSGGPAKAPPPPGGFKSFPPGGELVHWQLVPSTSFEAAPGSGIDYSAQGLNTVRIPPGDTLVRLTIHVKQAPNGCGEQGCTAEIQTRMNNINTNQPPYYRTAQFTVRPAQ